MSFRPPLSVLRIWLSAFLAVAMIAAPMGVGAAERGATDDACAASSQIDDLRGHSDNDGHDHPAQTACGHCHGHALGSATHVVRLSPPRSIATIFTDAFGIRLSLPNGLFRPPRV
ncbi:DUF2946 family protein [Parvularcula oceani]|uniref:DUF2946 family protein n=1 Tax=Parvularcula oceani TaxID=1247963 RepID=UPI003B504400